MYLLMVANAWAQLSVEDRERGGGGVKNVYCWIIIYFWTSLKLNFLIKSLNKGMNIPTVLPNYPIKMWGKTIDGLKSYDRLYQKRLLLYL